MGSEQRVLLAQAHLLALTPPFPSLAPPPSLSHTSSSCFSSSRSARSREWRRRCTLFTRWLQQWTKAKGAGGRGEHAHAQPGSNQKLRA